METGSLQLALFAAVTFLGGLVLETRVLLRLRTRWYFSLGIPLAGTLVPVPRAPEGKGRTASVQWEVAEPGLVRFWANPDERKAPSGLHGIVQLVPTVGGGYGLSVRWAPPWIPLLAALWLALLGAARGEAALTVPIAVLIVAAILFVYGERARRVAHELRQAFLDVAPPDPD